VLLFSAATPEAVALYLFLSLISAVVGLGAGTIAEIVA